MLPIAKPSDVDINLYLGDACVGKTKLRDLMLFKLNIWELTVTDFLIDFLVITRSQLYPFFKGVINRWNLYLPFL